MPVRPSDRFFSVSVPSYLRWPLPRGNDGVRAPQLKLGMGGVVSGGCAGDRAAGIISQPEDSDEALKWHIGSLGYCAASNHFDIGRTLGKGSYGHVR